MKNIANNISKAILATISLCFVRVAAIAQDSTNMTINTEQVEGWFSQNWMWVAIGAVVLIVIIAMMSGGKKSSVKKTTIVKEEDASGLVRTTTTEIKE
jgi:protein-S-isoprenylcysteine O-methyltransferase Ste14